MAGAQSFINYLDASGATPLYAASQNGHASVTKQLIEARCNIDLQKKVKKGMLPSCSCFLQRAVTLITSLLLRRPKRACGRHGTAHRCALQRRSSG